MRLHALFALSFLTLAGCGNAPDAGSIDPTPAAQAAALTVSTPVRSVSAGHYELSVDGKSCGMVQSVSGGDAEGVVIENKVGTDGIARKHIGGVKYNEFAVSIPLAQSPCTDWVRDTLAGTGARKDGAIVAADYNYNVQSTKSFSHALITEVGFPALDGSSKDAAYLTIKFVPETVRVTKGGGKLAAPNAQQKPALVSNFTLTMSGLDTRRVAKIDALTVKQGTTRDAVGEGRDYSLEPGKIEVPNLSFSVSDADADQFSTWHQAFVIDGKNDPSQEKTATLVYLDASLKKPILTLNLSGVGIFKVAGDPVVNGDDKIHRVTVSSYVDTMTAAFAE